MTERTARRLAHGLWLATMALWAAGVTLALAEDAASGAPRVLLGLPIALYASLGALVARRRPDNPIGWLFGAVALSLALNAFGAAYAGAGLAGRSGIGTLPGATAAAWVSVLGPFTVLPWALPAFLVLFPSGHLPSRRWSLGVATAVLGSVAMVVGFAGRTEGEFGSSGLSSPALIARLPRVDLYPGIGLALTFAASVVGVIALVRRFRVANVEERQPLRLLVVMIAAMVAASSAGLAIAVASQGSDWGWFGWILVVLVDGFGILIGIPVASAAAVLTFGLYDVGIVMKKTVVYGLLVGLFVLLLAFVSLFLSPVAIMGISADPGSGGGRDMVARVATTASVMVLALALGMRPAKRLARRMVFGKRATPYEAMAAFSERLGETYATDDVLPRTAQIVRASTGADVARVWLRIGRELRPVASAPAEVLEPSPLPALADELPEIPGARAFPVRHRGVLLGALTVEMPRAEPLSKTGEKLVTDLASQAGLVLRNVRLIEELQESRRRIVTAQDERARKLERDIHDGAQQQLVALSVKLGLAERLIGREPDKAATLLGELRTDATDALDTLRDLARGIYPPLLADKGLTAALEAQARKSPVPTTVRAIGVGRYRQDAEAAVYFCALEALQNTTKYANATYAEIAISDGDGQIAFSVTDDGKGFDTSVRSPGTGLQGMADRLASIGGSLRIESQPGHGTTVSGLVPLGPSARQANGDRV